MAEKKKNNEFYVHLPNGDFNDLTDVGEMNDKVDFELSLSNYPYILITREVMTVAQYNEIDAFITKVLRRKNKMKYVPPNRIPINQKTSFGIVKSFEYRCYEIWYLILGDRGLFWMPEHRLLKG